MKRYSLCGLVWMVTLAFGWWPLRLSAPNDVVWSEAEGAVAFKAAEGSRGGIGYGAAVLDLERFRELTLLLEVKTASQASSLGVILELAALDRSHRHPPLKIAQWQDHLAIRSGRRTGGGGRERFDEIGYRHCFSTSEFVRILISGDHRGVLAQREGALQETYPAFTLLDPEGEGAFYLIVGNEAGGKEPFSGSIRRIALYDRRAGSFAELEQMTPAAVMDLGASGSLARPGDPGWSGQALLAPERLRPLQRRFLEFPSLDAIGQAGYWRDVWINFLGFMPLGVCLAWILLPRDPADRRLAVQLRAVALAAVGCLATSLSIEIGQAYLVWRHSSLLDLILNGSGGIAGVFAALGFQRLALGLSGKPESLEGSPQLPKL